MRLIVLSILLHSFCWAQQEPDQAELKPNEVEELFYEAVKQKSIENYDKAISALQNAVVLDAKNPELFYQLGVNYLALKKYTEAEESFIKAKDLNPKERWYWNGIYDVYYQTKEYKKAIPIVEKLTEFDVNMREDLVSLYMNTQQLDKAKLVLDKIESTGVLTKTMELYKMQILAMNKPETGNETALINAIKSNPKVEQNYIDLIYLYSSQNNEQKAFEIAQQLSTEIPTSDLAHVSLMKFYIDKQQGDLATQSFKRVAKSTKIDIKLKHRVLNEFLIFTTKNPNYITELDAVLPYYENSNEFNVYKELAKYYYNKDLFVQAEKYFEKAHKSDMNDIQVIDLLLNTYDFNGNYEEMASTSEKLMELYPVKPNLYYYAGKAYNKTNKYLKAKEVLLNGMDYVLDDKELLIGFYKQMVFVGEGLKDQNLKQQYLKKIDQTR